MNAGLLAAHRAHHEAARLRVNINGRFVLVMVAFHRLCSADPLAAYADNFQVSRIRAVHGTIVPILAGMVVALIVHLAPGHFIRGARARLSRNCSIRRGSQMIIQLHSFLQPTPTSKYSPLRLLSPQGKHTPSSNIRRASVFSLKVQLTFRCSDRCIVRG